VGTDCFKEFVEEWPGVVRAGSRLRVILDGKDGLVSMPKTLDGAVVQVHMG